MIPLFGALNRGGGGKGGGETEKVITPSWSRGQPRANRMRDFSGYPGSVGGDTYSRFSSVPRGGEFAPFYSSPNNRMAGLYDFSNMAPYSSPSYPASDSWKIGEDLVRSGAGRFDDRRRRPTDTKYPKSLSGYGISEDAYRSVYERAGYRPGDVSKLLHKENPGLLP